VDEDLDDEPTKLISIDDADLGDEWAYIYVNRDDGDIEIPIWCDDEDAHEDDCPGDHPIHVLIMTPDQARLLAGKLIHAAAHGECQQRKN
jgi:hypothetical protein